MQNYTDKDIGHYKKSKQIQYESYFLNDQLHRLDGPAYTEYYRNCKIRIESYYTNGSKHRIGGPARTTFNEDGSIDEELYYVNNILHRTDGPAFIKHRPWWPVGYLNGERIDLVPFIRRMVEATNKTEELVKILNEAGSTKLILLNVLSQKFKYKINPTVLDNLNLFI